MMIRSRALTKTPAKPPAVDQDQAYQSAMSAATPAAQAMAAINRNLREEVGTTRQAMSFVSRHKTENTTIPKKGQPICPEDQKKDVMMVHPP